jgi:hypothetical protein
MGLIGKKGKPTARSLDQAPYGWVALRRFCPTYGLKRRRRAGVVGFDGVTGLNQRDGWVGEPTYTRSARP